MRQALPLKRSKPISGKDKRFAAINVMAQLH